MTRIGFFCPPRSTYGRGSTRTSRCGGAMRLLAAIEPVCVDRQTGSRTYRVSHRSLRRRGPPWGSAAVTPWMTCGFGLLVDETARVTPNSLLSTDAERPSLHVCSVVMPKKRKPAYLPTCVLLTDGAGKSFRF